MNPMTARLNSVGLSYDMAWDAFVIVTALLPAMHVLTAALVALKNRGVRSPRTTSVGTLIPRRASHVIVGWGAAKRSGSVRAAFSAVASRHEHRLVTTDPAELAANAQNDVNATSDTESDQR